MQIGVKGRRWVSNSNYDVGAGRHSKFLRQTGDPISVLSRPARKYPYCELLSIFDPRGAVGKDLSSGIITSLLGMWRNWQTRMT